MGNFYRWEYRVPLLLLVLTAFVCTSFLFDSKTDYAKYKVDTYYIEHLSNLDETIAELGQAQDNKQQVELFKKARLLYKKIEFLIEYYNLYQARNLNGAMLLKAEDDNPTDTIFPHGLQVVESLIYGGANISKIKTELNFIHSTISELKDEHDRKLKYSDATIFDALRLQIFRIITLGITGFDSPVALYSIPEAESALSSVADVIQLYRTHLDDSSKVNEVLKLVTLAQVYLSSNANFNKFDRLTFIKDHAEPLTRAIRELAVANGYTLQPDRRPLKVSATSLFENDAFNLDFFSPNENYRVTKERVDLGRKLFYDPILSSTGIRSCASCHKPELAFADGVKLPKDISGEVELDRNTPTLINSVFQTRQFYDMRTSKLENQLSDVVHNKKEMGGSLKRVIPLLLSDGSYKQAFSKAYAADKEPVTEYTIANAISSYVRSLTDLNSKFDEYMREENKPLTKSERNGFNLFMGKAKCATCHFMPIFNGLVPPVFSETEAEVLGVPQSPGKKKPTLDRDPGRGGFTRIPLHNFAFKTPTLRNIALTAPYMHNGVYNTLEEVIDFYNEGGGTALGIAPSNQTLPAEKLNLSRSEKRDLKAFLFTLTGKTNELSEVSAD